MVGTTWLGSAARFNARFGAPRPTLFGARLGSARLGAQLGSAHRGAVRLGAWFIIIRSWIEIPPSCLCDPPHYTELVTFTEERAEGGVEGGVEGGSFI